MVASGKGGRQDVGIVGELRMDEKQFCYARRVPFDDTDMAGVVRFTRLLAYAEEAEHAALAAAGVPVAECGWPRVRVEGDFKSPARFGDELAVSVRCVRLGRSSLTWGWRIAAADARVVAEGVSVVCHTGADGKPSQLPEPWREALSRYC